LRLQVRPKAAPGSPAAVPAALEPTYLGGTGPPAQFPPGTLVRVTGWVKLVKPVQASADGALLFDSVGGEPLGVRMVSATPNWQKFALYRRGAASGAGTVAGAVA